MAPTYTRTEIGLRLPKGVTGLSWRQINTIFVHYTAAEYDRTGNPFERLRGIQDMHMGSGGLGMPNGGSDIAYNKAFSYKGAKFNLRGWEVKSGATGSENDHSQAIVFLGTDKAGRDDVTDKGRRAAGELIREAMRFKKNADGGMLIVKGHTEAPGKAGATACPGDELLAYIHLKGWQTDEFRGYPKRFFLWTEWWLGEGRFKKYGPHNRKVRPRQLRGMPITPYYWFVLRRFLKQRRK